MASTDIAGIHFVIVEIFTFQRPGFIANQAVFGNLGRIEFDLNFNIIGDGEKRPG